MRVRPMWGLAAAVATVASVAGCGSSSEPPEAGAPIAGCDGARLVASDPDRSERGYWSVGARTVSVQGLTAEVWYPVAPEAAVDATPVRYDIRLHLPDSEAAKISDADNPWQSCDCYRDLPLDEAHGPYPVIVFVHGTAAFRHQSLSIVTHWASRGFVVVAADHPGLVLEDLLTMACGGTAPSQNLTRDIDQLLAAVAAPAEQLAFLAGHVAADRVAIAGHSAGANAAGTAAGSGKPGVRLAIEMAGNRSVASGASVFFAGTADTIVSQGQARVAFDGSTPPRQFVALEAGGHLAFSDLCETRNAAGADLLTIATEKGVCGAQLAGFLFDCDPTYLSGPLAWAAINDVSTAALEEHLQCQPAADLGDIRSRYPQIATFVEVR